VARAGSTLGRVAGVVFAQLDEALAAAAPGDLGVYVRLGAAARGLGPGRGEKLAAALLELAKARYRSAPGVRSLDLATGAEVPEPETVGAARGVDLALFLDVDVAEGFLVLAGDLVVTDDTPWAGAAAGAAPHVSPVAAKIFARERLDAELRFLLGAVPTKRGGKLRVDVYPQEGRDVLALAVGDLDGDGHSELVVLERERIRVLRWLLPGDAPAKAADPDAPLAFGAVAAASFAALPHGGERSRDAVGTLLLAELDGAARPPAILARTSDLAGTQAFRFAGGALVAGERWAGWPIAVYPDGGRTIWLGAELGTGSAVFGPGLPVEAVAADGTRTRLDSVDAGAAFVARVRRDVHGADGARPVVATVDEMGRLAVADGDAVARWAGPVGFALDVGDLDDDGKPEVAVAGGATPGDPDELLLLDVNRGAIKERWRSGAVDGEVRAVTIGDVDHDGRIDVVAALRTPDGGFGLLVVSRD
jgi:hypothetical protein